MVKVGSTEIRNRLKNKPEKKCGEKIETPELLNECSWDAVSVAKRRLQILPKNAPQAKPLDKKQLEEVKKFRRKVENVAYSRLCSSAQPKSMTKTKSSLKQLNETFGPVLTVFVSMASCFLGTEYFLKNIVHDFGLRFAIGLILASLLAIVELIMILKKLA